MNKKIFISYPHKPEQCVKHVIMALKDRLVTSGFDIWLDERIKTGHDWRQEITKGLQESEWVLVFLNSHATRKDSICLDEIAMAARYKRGQIVSVLLEPEDDIKTPLILGRIQFVKMEEWEKQYKADKGGKAWNEWLQKQADELIAAFERRTDLLQRGELDLLHEVLQPDQYWDEIANRLDGFVGREWIIKEITQKLKESDGPQMLWLNGGPGIGKTSIAARLAHDLELPAAGVYFCRFDRSQTHSAHNVIRTLAYQMACTVPAYRQMLVRQLHLGTDSSYEKIQSLKDELKKLTVYQLFKKLLVDPTYIGGEPHLLIIDGLDEITTEGGDNEIAKLLSGQEFRSMQKWLRVLITSRPDALLKELLSHVEATTINAQSTENLADLREYLEQQTCLGYGDIRNKAIETLLTRSEGAFVYLSKTIDALNRGILSPEQPDSFPTDLNALYRNYMQRAYPGPKQFKEEARPLLELILASPEPLPVDVVVTALGVDSYFVNEFASAMGALLDVDLLGREQRLSLFHRSFAEWLGQASVPYCVDITDGIVKLAKIVWLTFGVQGRLVKGEYITESLSWLLSNLTGGQLREVFGPPSDAILENLNNAVECLMQLYACYDAGQLQKIVISETTIFYGITSKEVIDARLKLAGINLVSRNYEMARHEYELLLEMPIIKLQHNDLLKYKILNGLSDCYLVESHLFKSSEMLKKSFTIAEEALSVCIDIYGYKSLETSDSLVRLSMVEKNLGIYDNAITDIKKSLRILYDIKGYNHVDTVRCLIKYASLLHDKENNDRKKTSNMKLKPKGLFGKVYLRFIENIYENKFNYSIEDIYNYVIDISSKIDLDIEDLVELYNHYSCYLIDNKKYNEAIISLKKEEEIISGIYDGDDVSFGALYFNMGTALKGLGNLEESIVYCHKSLAVRKACFGNESQRVAETAHSLARSYIKIFNFASAEKFLNEAQRIYKNLNCFEKEALVWEDFFYIAQHYFNVADFDRSESLFEKILDVRIKRYGYYHISCFGCLVALYNISVSKKQKNLKYYEQAKKVYYAIAESHPELSYCDKIFSEEHTVAHKQPSIQASRNAPCPCGSNKKYKKCCGA